MRTRLSEDVSILGLALMLVVTTASAGQAAARTVELDIETQPLGESLKTVAEAFQLQIAFFPEDAQNIEAPALAGRFSANEALARLLENTSLEHRYVNEDSVAIGARKAGGGAAPRKTRSDQSDSRVRSRGRGAHDERGAREQEPKEEGDEDRTENEEKRGSGGAEDSQDSDEEEPMSFGEEITVTATRRDESAQDVPMSVYALTREKIEQKDIVSFVDYGVEIPNMSFAPSNTSIAANALSITIRGVAGRETTGFYIDDTPLPEGLNPRVIDMERIETLRGPQGTLFGARSLGGTIRLITTQPRTPDLSGYVHATAGSIEDGSESYRVDASINAPLSENAALRVTGYRQSIGGFIDIEPDPASWVPGDPSRPLLTRRREDVNSHDVTGIQLSGRFELLGKRLSVTPRFMYEDVTYDGRTEIDVAESSDLEDRSNARPFDLPETTENEWQLGTLTIDYDTGVGLFTSASSWFDRDARDFEDTSIADAAGALTGIPGVPLLPLLQFLNPAFPAFPEGALSPILVEASLESDSFTQELRFASNWEGPWRLTTGLFYQDTDTLVRFPPTALPPIPTDVLDLFSTISETTVEEKAAFAEVHYGFSDRLRLIVGGRYFDNTVSISNFQGGTFGSGLTISETQAEDDLIPRFGVQYDIQDTHMLYATVSEGFRIGGPNTLPLGLCEDDILDVGLSPSDLESFESDSLRTYEMGYKSGLSAGRVRLNTALFLTEWKDIQQRRQFQCGFGAFLNLGRAEIRGGEVELNTYLTSDLSLSFGVGYNDSEIVDNGGFNDVLPLGASIQDVPDWTLNGALDWRFMVSEQPLFAYLSFSYVDQSEGRHQVGVDRTRDSYSLIDFRVGTFLGDGRYTLALFVRNLTDEAADFGNKLPLGLDVPGLKRTTVSYPRTIGLDLRYNF